MGVMLRMFVLAFLVVSLASQSARADDEEDIVEVIDDPSSTTRADESRSDASEPGSWRFGLGGWTRVFGALGGPFLGVSGDGARVPTDPVRADGAAFARGHLAYERTLSLVVAASLFARVRRIDDPGVRSGTVSELDPTVLEAHVDASSGDFRAELGFLRVPWGKGEAFSPNDVVNARDSREPILAESTLTHLPMLGLRALWSTREASIDVVASPWFTRPRIHWFGTSAASIQASAPALHRAVSRAAWEPTAPEILEMIRAPAGREMQPAVGLDAASAGARITVRPSDIEVSATYHYGFGSLPTLRVAEWVRARAGKLDVDAVDEDLLVALLAESAARGPLLLATWERRHHIGASIEVPARSLVLRVEAAADSASVFNARSLDAIVKPIATAVLGVEYQTGEIDNVVLCELVVRHIVDLAEDTRLVAAAETSFAAFALVRWIFFEHIETEFRALVDVVPFGVVVIPELGWKEGPFSARVGVAIFAGERDSTGGYFSQGTAAFAKAKWSF